MASFSLAEQHLRNINAATTIDAWWNITAPYGSPFNGTDVEGNKSLNASDFFFQQLVANNVAVAALTLYIWEFITTLPDEIRLYRAHKLWSRQVLLFILVRYGTLPSLILPAFSVWHDFSKNPSGCLQHQQIAICFVQLIVSIVFAWRTITIWGHDRRVTILSIAVVLALFGASFGLLWFSQEALLPNGACMPVTPKSGFNPLLPFYVIAFFYDLFTASMSGYKLISFAKLGSQDRRQTDYASERSFLTLPNQITSSVKWHIYSISSSPTVHRMLQAGLVYFLVATLFNAIAFSLEIAENIHSKALITLYAPLMCILCQRIILLDTKTIWGELDPFKSGSREQALIDRVLKERRRSWEGSDAGHAATGRAIAHDEKTADQGSGSHIAVDMDAAAKTDDLSFQDMLSQPLPSKEEHKTRVRIWKDPCRKATAGAVPSPSASSSSSSSSTITTFSPVLSSQPHSTSARSQSMSEADKATALKLAGVEPPS